MGCLDTGVSSPTLGRLVRRALKNQNNINISFKYKKFKIVKIFRSVAGARVYIKYIISLSKSQCIQILL